MAQQAEPAIARRIGTRLGARRVVIGWFLDDRIVLSHQWTRPFAPVFRPQAGGMPTATMPAWTARVTAGDVVRIAHRDDLGAEWESERAWLATNEIVASLSVPVRDDGDVVGFVMVDDDQPRSWADDAVAIVAEVATRLRRGDDRAVADEVDWAAVALEDLPVPVAALDAEGDWVYANRRMRDLSSRPASSSPDRLLSDVPATDIERLRTVVRPVLEGRQTTTSARLEVWGRPIEARFVRVPPRGSVRGLVIATPVDTDAPVEGIDVLAALRGGACRVAYQPIVSADDRVVGAEALLRVEDPLLGVIATDIFIDAAERGGTVPAIDRFVVDRALGDVDRLRGAVGGGDFMMSVNLSAQTLDDGIAAHLEDAAVRHGVAFADIQVEVTETRALRSRRAHAELGRLADAGVSIALDDFGTGYTSFDNLVGLPLAGVKLDRSVIAGTVDHRGELVARGVVDLAIALGLRVVAEGVEDGRDRSMVADLGCSSWQGYRFSPAVPVDDFPGRPVRADA